METVDTPYGPVHRKVSSGYGVRREKYEYEDLASIAKAQNLSLSELSDEISSPYKRVSAIAPQV